MKKHLLILCLCLFVKPLFGQIEIQELNVAIPFGTADTFDINQDSLPEVLIGSFYSFDAAFMEGYCDCDHTVQRISFFVVLEGQPFQSFYTNCTIDNTPVGCSPWDWQIEPGYRYMGYYNVNAPQDTTFGYFTLDFAGDSASCDDTIFVLSNTFSLIPNVHLLAGQTTSAQTPELVHVKVFPNPVSDKLTIQKGDDLQWNLELLNSSSKSVRNQSFSGRETTLDVSGLPWGVYFLRFQQQHSLPAYKAIIVGGI